MYTAQFSEFSYGYALTDNILHSGLPCTPHAPVFPSLYAEGSAGGGYDVGIPLHPVAIFLQFKIPQVMRRASKNMPGTFSVPYMRMHVRTKRPNQHQLLLQLEAAGRRVYYATPDFWRTPELDTHFWHGDVHMESCYFLPSSIGALDAAPHHVAYEVGNLQAYLCSDPKPIERHAGSENFGKEINASVTRARRQEPVSFFNGIAQQITEITGYETEITRRRPDVEGPRTPERKKAAEAVPRVPAVSLEVRRIAREAAYLSQVRLGCTLVVTGRN